MIGTRGHDIGKKSAEELAEEMKNKGFESIQLVAYKCIEGISEKSGHLTPALAYKVGHEFNKRCIHIALLGSYFNLLDPNKDNVDEGIKRFKEYLRYAKDFRCHLVGTETGSVNSDYSYHIDNHSEESLDRVIDIFKELTNEAKNHGVMVGIEGVYTHVVSTPKRMKKLLDHVDSSNIQVIFDPVNLLHVGNYTKCNEIIEEAFKLYGEKIIVIHAKDFILKDNKIITVPLGKGLIDYPHFFKVLKQYKPFIDIIIEDVVGTDLVESYRYLKDKWLY